MIHKVIKTLFIDNVVIKGNDYKANTRNKIAKQEIMINYPNVVEKIYESIIEELKQ